MVGKRKEKALNWKTQKKKKQERGTQKKKKRTERKDNKMTPPPTNSWGGPKLREGFLPGTKRGAKRSKCQKDWLRDPETKYRRGDQMR